MRPIEFPEQNCVYAKDQPAYIPLPVHKRESFGEVVSCWGLTWRERFHVLIMGKVWLSVLTFNQPLQPQKMSASFARVMEG